MSNPLTEWALGGRGASAVADDANDEPKLTSLFEWSFERAASEKEKERKRLRRQAIEEGFNLSPDEQSQIISTVEPSGFFEQTARNTIVGSVGSAINRATLPEGIPYVEPSNVPLNWAERMASQTGSFLSDVAMGPGALGGIVGGTVKRGLLRGSIEGATTLGTITAVRAPLEQYAATGGVDAGEALLETGKSAALGATLSPLARGGARLGAPLGKIAEKAGATTLEVAGLGAGSAALEGRMPTTEDFIDAAGLVLGLKGAARIAQLAGRFRNRGPNDDPIKIAEEVIGKDNVAKVMERLVQPKEARQPERPVLEVVDDAGNVVDRIMPSELRYGDKTLSTEQIGKLAQKADDAPRGAGGVTRKAFADVVGVDKSDVTIPRKEIASLARKAQEIRDAERQVQDVRGVEEGRGVEIEGGGDNQRGGQTGAEAEKAPQEKGVRNNQTIESLRGGINPTTKELEEAFGVTDIGAAKSRREVIAANIAQKIGVPLVEFYTSNDPVAGRFTIHSPNSIYVKRGVSTRETIGTAIHESIHWMKINDPARYRELKKAYPEAKSEEALARFVFGFFDKGKGILLPGVTRILSGDSSRPLIVGGKRSSADRIRKTISVLLRTTAGKNGENIQRQAEAGTEAGNAETRRIANEPAATTESAQSPGVSSGVVEAGAAGIDRPSSLKKAATEARAEVDSAFIELTSYLQGRTFSTPLLDPQLLKLTGNVVAKSVKAGVLTFADVVAETARTVGVETTRRLAPVLRAQWNRLRSENEKLGEVEDVDAVLSRLTGRKFEPLGRPDLANPATDPEARKFVDVVDADRQVQARKDVEVQTEAAVRIEADYAGERAKLLRSVREGKKLGDGDTDTLVAKSIVSREIAESLRGDSVEAIKDAVDLVHAYRETGTEQARGFRQRRDPVETPNERRARLLGESLLEPPKRMLDRMKDADAKEADRIRQLWAKDIVRIKKELAALGIDLGNIREVASNDINAATALRAISSRKADAWDSSYEYWRNAILSAPTTHAVNLTGNVANATWTLTAQRIIEATSNLGVRDPKAAQFGELKYLYGGILPGLSRAAKNFVRTWRTEIPYFEKELGTPLEVAATKIEQPNVAIGGKKGRVIRAPQRFLLASDEAAKSLFATMDVGAQAYRIAKSEGLKEAKLESRIRSLVDDLSSEAWQRALQTARELTFQEKGGPLTRSILSLRRDVPGVRYQIPFVTTPASIFRQGIRRSPLGSLMIPYRVVEAIRTGDRSVLNVRVAEQILGWAGALALMDMTDPDDPWLTGTGPYDNAIPPQSIRIAGRWFSYARIEPFATIVSTTVDMIDSLRHGGTAEAIGEPITSVIRQARDKTFLQGFGDIAEMIERSRRGESLEAIADWSSNFAVSWIPNMVRSTARGMKSEIPERRVWGDKGEWWQRLSRRMAQKTELSLVPDHPKIDLWGRPVKRPGGPVTDIPWRILSPVTSKPDDLVKGDRIIVNWNNQHSDDQSFPVGPARPSYVRKGKTYYFDDAEYERFLRLAGERAAQLVEQGSFNVEQPTERDMDKLKNIIDKSREAARRTIVRERS